MFPKHRRYFSPQDKIAILRQNLLEGMTESEVCKASNVSGSVLRRWKVQLLQNGAGVFQPQRAKGNRQSKVVATPANAKSRTRQAQQFQECLISIIQPKTDVAALAKRTSGGLGHDEISRLVDCIGQRPLKYRNRAIAILLYHMQIRVSKIAHFLGRQHLSDTGRRLGALPRMGEALRKSGFGDLAAALLRRNLSSSLAVRSPHTRRYPDVSRWRA